MSFVFGGPEKYTGKDLAAAHEKLIREQGLNRTHWNQVADALHQAFVELNVPAVSSP